VIHGQTRASSALFCRVIIFPVGVVILHTSSMYKQEWVRHERVMSLPSASAQPWQARGRALELAQDDKMYSGNTSQGRQRHSSAA
jgi:hypothetical protein